MSIEYLNKTYYDGNNVTVFPSATAPTHTQGRLLSENMIASIGSNTVSRNYIVRGFNMNLSGRTVIINAGVLYLNGRIIQTNSDLSITIPNSNNGNNTYSGVVVIMLSKNSLGEVLGNTADKNQGIVLTTVETTDYNQFDADRDFIVLGYVANLVNNDDITSGVTWFENMNIYNRIDAKYIYVDTSFFRDEVQDDIENLTDDDLINSNSNGINRNDDSYNRDLNLQDYINLVSSKWSFSKYGDDLFGDINVVCDNNNNHEEVSVTFWKSNYHKINNDGSNSVKISYHYADSKSILVNGNIRINDNLNVINNIITNNSIIARNTSTSNVVIKALQNSRHILLKDTSVEETNNLLKINTNLNTDLNFNNSVINISNVSKITHKTFENIEYAGSVSYITNNGAVYDFNNNSTFRSNNFTNISLQNNSNVSFGNNTSIIINNNSLINMRDFKAYSNGTIKANIIDLTSTSPVYMYMSRTRNVYITYSGYDETLNLHGGLSVTNNISCNGTYTGRNVVINANHNIKMGNNTYISICNFRADSNGNVKANVVDLTSTSTSYIYFKNNSVYMSYNYSTNTIHVNGYTKFNGVIECTGSITGSRVYNAVYNDYAELYEKDNNLDVIEHGDVVEVNPLTGRYRKCISYNSKYVVGVCSNSYGILLGGKKGVSEEENLKSYIPIGLCGRVFVKTDDNSINIGDLLVSTKDGKATKSHFNIFKKSNIIGKALSYPKNGYVYMQVLLS